MKTSIPQFLEEKLSLKGTARANKFPNEIKKFMIDYSNFYNWNTVELQTIYRLMKKDVSELPTCSYKDCREKVRIDCEGNLTVGCCREHSLKANNLKNLGVESNMHTEESKNKFRETCMEKYGVSNPMQDKEIQDRNKHSLMKSHGVDNIFKSETFKEKVKQQNLEKYGVEYTWQAEDVKEKSRKTMLKRYGVTSARHNPKSQEKLRKTNLKKYGGTHHMHNKDIFDKTSKSCYKTKEFKWKSGEISIVQGFEDIVLAELEEQGYNFDEVVTSSKMMPSFKYEFEGKVRKYYPDIYIPDENLIIEVKSDYTYKSDLEKNLKKFEAVKSKGFNFKLEIR